MKVIGVITARKGSKRLPNKNKKMLCGKPLIVYTIEQALKSRLLDEIIVTTDDEDIKQICKGYDVKVIDRPKELAEDHVEAEYPALDAVKDYKGDIVIVILQPTSPLRDYKLIDKCIDTYIESQYLEGVITVYEKEQYTFVPSADVYVINRYILENYGLWNNDMGLIIVPKSSVYDIDTQEDFDLVEKVIDSK